MHINTLWKIFTLIHLWQNPVQLDPQSLWFSCCRTGKPRGKDGECFTSLFPVCPPCKAPAHLEHPSAWAAANTLLQTHPYALLLLGSKEGMKADSTARAKHPCRQRSWQTGYAERQEQQGRAGSCRSSKVLPTPEPCWLFSSLPWLQWKHCLPMDLRLTAQLCETRLAHKVCTSKTSKQFPAAPFKPATCHTLPLFPT